MKAILAAIGCAGLLAGCAVVPYDSYGYGAPYDYGYDYAPYYYGPGYGPGYYYGPSLGFSYYGGHYGGWHGHGGHRHGSWHGHDGGHDWHATQSTGRTHGIARTGPSRPSLAGSGRMHAHGARAPAQAPRLAHHAPQAREQS